MLGRIIKHDICYGISSNKIRYLSVIVTFVAINLNFYSTVNQLSIKYFDTYSVGVLNVWVHSLEGTGIFEPSLGMPFAIPMNWFVLQALLALLILSYPTQNLYGYGSQCLIRMEWRSIWWLSKCIWNLCTVASFYLIGIITTCLWALLNKRSLLEYSIQISLSVSGINLSSYSLTEILMLTLLLPFLTSLALSFIQMILSMVLSPIYGYFIVICNALISAYCYSPFLIANYSMMLRHESITPNGYCIRMAIIVDSGVILLSVIGGLIYFMRCDILKTKKQG